MSDKYDLMLTAILIGDTNVGKTCMLIKYVDDKFSPTRIATIGTDFKVKNLVHYSKRIKIQIWDTAGQERFNSVNSRFLKTANIVFIGCKSIGEGRVIVF